MGDMQLENNNDEIIRKYDAVRNSLESAIKASDNIELSGEEENAELEFIRSALKDMNQDFKEEIERLEKSSEWDKFCIAFFGETNAGKSTIIEALRIVYDEENRRRKLDKQFEKTQAEIEEENSKYMDLINSLIELNDSIEVQEETSESELKDQEELVETSKQNRIVWTIGLILIGIVIGFLIAFIIL